jgi:hypothetical protein
MVNPGANVTEITAEITADINADINADITAAARPPFP